MKKILFALFAVALIFNACTTTDADKAVTVILSKSSVTESTLSASVKEISFTITNSTDNSATINWERTATTTPTGFTYMVNGASANSGSTELAANEVATITLKVMPNGNTGVATGTLSFYDSKNQATTTKVLTYSVSAVAAYFSIAPQGSMSGTGTANVGTDYHIDVVNPNATPIIVTWEKIDGASNNSAWETAVCTDAVCWTPNVVKETMTVAANSTVDFKATIDPKGVNSTGTMDALFYVASDSAASFTNQVITHTVSK